MTSEQRPAPRDGARRVILVVVGVAVAFVVICSITAVAMFLTRDEPEPRPVATRAATAPPTPPPTQPPTSAAPAGPTTTVTVVLALNDAPTARRQCYGVGSYLDVSPATFADLRDESGASLGRTRLGRGTVAGDTCTYEFSFPGVRADATQYSLSVGLRDGGTRAGADLAAAGWRFEAELARGPF